MRLTILHQCFKFDVIRFTGYWGIAEKPRVGQLSRNFPCSLLDRKMNRTFLMVSTSSITVLSLGKIAQRAPAIGARMWCVCFLVNRRKLPQRGSGQSPDRLKFFPTIFSTQDGLSWHYNIVNCVIPYSLWPPLLLLLPLHQSHDKMLCCNWLDAVDLSKRSCSQTALKGFVLDIHVWRWQDQTDLSTNPCLVFTSGFVLDLS